MKNVIFIILSAFMFTACTATKEVNTDVRVENKQTVSKVEVADAKTDSTNVFEDEFEDEFNEEVKEIFDPLSGYNRAMTTFNDFFFMNVLNPVSNRYSKIVPEPVRVGVSNFFDNLMFPIRFSNNILQLKFANASEELGRFLINTTFGLAGFMDPAKTEFGLEAHDEDFGQTLGHYGVGSGFHVVLPLLGPSNLRDMVGLAADGYVDPTSTVGSSDINYKIPDTTLQSLAITSYKTTNSTSLKLGQYENIKKDALDLYPFLRDIYEQKRNKDIEE